MRNAQQFKLFVVVAAAAVVVYTAKRVSQPTSDDINYYLFSESFFAAAALSLCHINITNYCCYANNIQFYTFFLSFSSSFANNIKHRVERASGVRKKINLRSMNRRKRVSEWDMKSEKIYSILNIYTTIFFFWTLGMALLYIFLFLFLLLHLKFFILYIFEGGYTYLWSSALLLFSFFVGDEKISCHLALKMMWIC